MTDNTHVFSALRRNKTLLVIIAVALFLIEIEIFAVAVMKSGHASRLHVMNDAGVVVYEADGANLSRFDRHYFEKTFGPLENYHVKLVSQDRPFPFRAWFSAAVGIPVGLVLLFVFIVKAYAALFYGAQTESPPETRDAPQSRFDKVYQQISRLNIFVIGFLIFFIIFLYWVIPNTLTYLGRLGLETLDQFKWVLLGVAVVFTGIVVWVIYLRYLLAKKTIETRAEVERYRLELAYTQNNGNPPDQLALQSPEMSECPSVTWEEPHGGGENDAASEMEDKTMGKH